MEVLLVLSVVGMGIVQVMMVGSFGWVSIGIGIYTFLLANVLNFKDSLSRLYHSSEEQHRTHIPLVYCIFVDS